MFKSEIRLPSGKQPHSYGKIHHFSWENPLFLWPFSMLNYQRVRKTMHKPIWSKVSGLVRLCALIIHVYPCLCRDSDGLKSSTSHRVTHGATHCAQGHMLHPWGKNPLFNKNQMSQVTLLVDMYWFQKNTTICSKQFRCWYWFWCEFLHPLPVPCQVPLPSHSTREEGAQRGRAGEPIQKLQSWGLRDAPLEKSAHVISIHAVQMFWQNLNLIPGDKWTCKTAELTMKQHSNMGTPVFFFAWGSVGAFAV